MFSLLTAAPAVIAAYFVGSIPFGLLVARVFHGIDIRQAGSGNIGATNVGRTCGSRWGILVLLLDACKGALPVWLLPHLPRLWNAGWNAAESGTHLAVLCGLAAIFGHMYPCWLGFRGGKGVATGLGTALMLAPGAGGCAFLAFAVVFAISRIVSLSSLVASVAFAAVELWMLRPHPFSGPTWSLALFSLAAPVLIVLRHRENITRLVKGEEQSYRSGQRQNSGPAKPGTEAEEPGADSAAAKSESETPQPGV